MTATELSFILMPIAFLLIGAFWLGFVLGVKRKTNRRVHKAHSPAPEYDQEEIALAKGKGLEGGSAY